jgi:hypothetical protein
MRSLEDSAVSSNALWWYGLAAVVVGVLFTVSDFVALLVSTIDDPGEEALTDAYAGWAALSLFTLALLQVALIGLYVPQRGATGTLGWIGFLIAFIGTSITFLVVLIYAVVASPMTPADPGLLEAGPPGPFILYFPLFSLGWFLLGAAFLRSPVYPRPAALLLMVGAGLALYPHPITNIVFSAAIAWLGLSILLRRG